VQSSEADHPLRPPTADGRQPRAERFYATHRDLLVGRSVLDVGCDQRHLAPLVEADGGSYWGIGLGGEPDQAVDLEGGVLPFADRAYDVVVCLDVLEHLDAAHAILDEICRVARTTVVVVLPAPWSDIYRVLRRQPYRSGQAFKYNGLPVEPPGDRHRWFFATDDAVAFVVERGAAAGFSCVAVETEGARRRARHPLRTAAEWLLFRRAGLVSSLYAGRSTVVLERSGQSEPAAPA
jgi:SAM-dependent methyltransferase